MKKEQEAEAARRVLEERGKRTAYEKQHQQTIASEPVKSRVPETPKPSLPVQAVVPASVVASVDQDKTEEKEESSPPAIIADAEPVQVVENVPVAPSSQSIETETKNDSDDEWSSKTDEVPATTEPSEPSATVDLDEGLKCIARYAYEKSQFTHASNIARIDVCLFLSDSRGR